MSRLLVACQIGVSFRQPQRRRVVLTLAMVAQNKGTRECLSKDPQYEKRIQVALQGLTQGLYKTVTEAANAQKVSFYPVHSIVLMPCRLLVRRWRTGPQVVRHVNCQDRSNSCSAQLKSRSCLTGAIILQSQQLHLTLHHSELMCTRSVANTQENIGITGLRNDTQLSCCPSHLD